MNGWRGWGGEGEEGPDRTKVAFAAGAGLGLLVLGWMMFARSGEEGVSSSGFSEGGAAVASTPFSRDRRGQTGLAMVHPSDAAAPASVRLDSTPGASPYAAGASDAGAAGSNAPAAPAPAAATAAGAAAAAGSPAAVDPKEMAAAGLPTDAAGLKKMGGDSGMMTDAIARLIDHPRILKALFDNKLLVGALMDGDSAKRNCNDAGALQSALSSPGAGSYTGQMMGLVSSVLSRPDTVAALAGSEMGSRLLSCPSVHALASNPSGLMAIATANPQALQMVTDPRVAQALATIPQGPSLLGGVESSWSSGAGASAHKTERDRNSLRNE